MIALRAVVALLCLAAGTFALRGAWGPFWATLVAAGAVAEITTLVLGHGMLSHYVGWLSAQHLGVYVALAAALTALVFWLPYHWRLEPLAWPKLRGTLWDDAAIWIVAAGAYLVAYFALSGKKDDDHGPA